MEGTWRKSSYSDDGEGNCVELQLTHDRLKVRDSKAPDSGTLEFSPGVVAWLATVGPLDS